MAKVLVLFVCFFIVAVPMSAITITHWNEIMKDPMAIFCTAINCVSLILVILIGIFYIIPKFKKTN